MGSIALRLTLAASLASALSARAGSDPTIKAVVLDVATDYAWGYRVGVKQPVGSYQLGRSVHQISRRIEPPDLGSPEYLIWVDEHTGEARIIEQPVGEVGAGAVNPGGTAAFVSNASDPGEVGRIWFAYGARANDMPFDFARSTRAFDATEFDVMLDDFITDQGSTTPCLHAVGDDLLFTYRNGGSSWARVTARFQRYDAGTLALGHEVDLGKGYDDPMLGNFGIEQLWTRYDPRHDRLTATWQYFFVLEDRFGSNPYVYSDDHGTTWRRADGSPLGPEPVDYSHIDPVLVPFDHLAEGENTNWLARDIGVTPGGGHWLTLPHGNAWTSNTWTVYFWFWNGTAWEHRELTGGMPFDSKAHACVVTRDYIVLVYSEHATNNELRARVSRDDGRTWSDPVVVDTLEDHPNGSRQLYAWASAIQPADRYLDNAARFVLGYYQANRGDTGRRYKQSIRWIKVQVGPRSDFDGDAAVTTLDFIAYLNAWATADWRADFNDDGSTDSIDFLAFLNAFVAES